MLTRRLLNRFDVRARSEAFARCARTSLLAVAALALGCGSNGNSKGYGNGNGASDGDGGGGNGNGGAGELGGGAGDGSGGNSPTLAPIAEPDADSTTKVCQVATLGFRGEWGNGDVFADWLKGESTQGTTPLEDQVLTAELLSAYNIIVVENVRQGQQGQRGVGQGIGRSYSADEIEALHQWVARGGGLMTLTGFGDSSEITNVNSLLAPFGLSYGSNGILGAGGSTTPVTHWADHPLTKGITEVGVNNGYPVQGAGAALIAWEPTQGQYDVGRAVEYQSGHVFAWGDEWITYDSEWNQHPEYQVVQFWTNVFAWLSPTGQCKAPVPTPPK